MEYDTECRGNAVREQGRFSFLRSRRGPYRLRSRVRLRLSHCTYYPTIIVTSVLNSLAYLSIQNRVGITSNGSVLGVVMRWCRRIRIGVVRRAIRAIMIFVWGAIRRVCGVRILRMF
ncbi:hypothetical protein L207DRAFT_335364 [Hyaloscypha variabilis F]|uniref:Uncharacterized protein n=1 Tax=Hyaloscypha variabilis (strain UAMH 11265 / GT02V1 / F) TaxID=1149755 RepID=A0A2J6RNW0_HYAVF|nr:hypothetical protein L207DRAFT_335364 [Hyaloscypha variabilis F]